MSERIRTAFLKLRTNDGKGFIPFITAGDPDLETTLAILRRLAELGATVIELGVPFTDPMADGPVIQRSSQRALERVDVGIGAILGVVSEARKTTDVPIILFGYLNPFLSYGLDRLVEDSAKAGVDGLLVTDVVDREFHSLSETLGKRGLDLITLVAPTTTEERLEDISRSARGFIYAVSRTGVTGEGSEIIDSSKELVARIRSVTELPVAVGFGISTRVHIDEVLRFADAAVVGSAIVRVIEKCEVPDQVPDAVARFVAEGLGITAGSSGRDFAMSDA